MRGTFVYSRFLEIVTRGHGPKTIEQDPYNDDDVDNGDSNKLNVPLFLSLSFFARYYICRIIIKTYRVEFF